MAPPEEQAWFGVTYQSLTSSQRALNVLVLGITKALETHFRISTARASLFALQNGRHAPLVPELSSRFTTPKHNNSCHTAQPRRPRSQQRSTARMPSTAMSPTSNNLRGTNRPTSTTDSRPRGQAPATHLRTSQVREAENAMATLPSLRSARGPIADQDRSGVATRIQQHPANAVTSPHQHRQQVPTSPHKGKSKRTPPIPVTFNMRAKERACLSSTRTSP
eukprot:CAMPEP_0183298188 /NCGR_PEP_ID=MMETSP0160_2-20130417/5289_1 /TAXON_ID=2839 ORGANISM="Odontella Sinensis, Strain Grunow 1884" /NCGR_SAMPLE_ID=MMETSP0160_2 /ASSEMBLY_ACC=CAM_ASM_000250 /LENGTH=220 /DNA_ID=CAMNT_0025460169 /DNA_START=117 /DNA_END=777 /DNA_ORIENTATION=-